MRRLDNASGLGSASSGGLVVEFCPLGSESLEGGNEVRPAGAPTAWAAARRDGSATRRARAAVRAHGRRRPHGNLSLRSGDSVRLPWATTLLCSSIPALAAAQPPAPPSPPPTPPPSPPAPLLAPPRP